jgi:hypothetical protein
MRRPHAALFCASVGLLVAATPGLAAATPTYPQLIVSDLMLKYSLGTQECESNSTPDCHCTICHLTNAGGFNTVKMPFGMAMQANKLVDGSPTLLQSALTALDTMKIDSDCDGVPDIQQLMDGRDPNTGAFIDGSGKTSPPPHTCGEALQSFGCGSQIARGASGNAPAEGAAAVIAVLGVALARRRRSA